MPRKKTEGDNFSVDTSPGSAAHASLLRGEVSGEISTDAGLRPERGRELEALAPLFLRDATLARAWEETAAEGSALARIEALLDRINAERRALAASDDEAAFKDARDRMLSQAANRLRELI